MTPPDTGILLEFTYLFLIGMSLESVCKPTFQTIESFVGIAPRQIGRWKSKAVHMKKGDNTKIIFLTLQRINLLERSKVFQSVKKITFYEFRNITVFKTAHH
jgi:hypothetical protein